MPRLRTNEAELVATFAFSMRLLFRAFYKESAVWFWAPFSVRVNIDSNVEHEALVFLILVFRNDLFDVRIFELLITSSICTDDLSNLSFIDFKTEISLYT